MNIIIEHKDSLKVGEYFQLREFIVSAQYPDLLKDVILTEWQILKYHYLCKFLLDPLRKLYGVIYVTSAFRTILLNAKLSKVAFSQHLLAEAADFVIPKADPQVVFYFVTKILKFPGEFIWYDPERRYHAALPRIGVKSDHFIKKLAV